VGSNAEFPYHVDVLVDVDTLDGLCASRTRLDFVKIDVEGGELHVLHGGRRTIDRFRPTMLIEIESHHTARYDDRRADVVAWPADRRLETLGKEGFAGLRVRVMVTATVGAYRARRS
jgi:Methyltransferase FkbM domain